MNDELDRSRRSRAANCPDPAPLSISPTLRASARRPSTHDAATPPTQRVDRAEAPATLDASPREPHVLRPPPRRSSQATCTALERPHWLLAPAIPILASVASAVIRLKLPLLGRFAFCPRFLRRQRAPLLALTPAAPFHCRSHAALCEARTTCWRLDTGDTRAAVQGPHSLFEPHALTTHQSFLVRVRGAAARAPLPPPRRRHCPHIYRLGCAARFVPLITASFRGFCAHCQAVFAGMSRVGMLAQAPTGMVRRCQRRCQRQRRMPTRALPLLTLY